MRTVTALLAVATVFVGTSPSTARDEVEIAAAHRFDPVRRDIEGWTVWVDPQMVEGDHAEMGARALRMLADHLHRIALLVDPEPLENLRRVEIWIEVSNPVLKPMQYHPSRKWLIDHGHDPRLEKKVHIPHAGELLKRHTLLKHPMVVLHELAHGYHDQVLSFDHVEIRAAYENACEQGLYEDVLLFTGARVRHYALTNHKEYFAEATEAYFYRNDFYPFVRAELREYDPVGYQVLERIWGKLD